MNKFHKLFGKEFHYWIILAITTLIAIFYFALNVNSWKFTNVGDDWAFYEFARNIVRDGFSINPLGLSGVYGTNPVLGSFYQAIFLKIFGLNNFAWRLSNVVLIIPVSLFFFLWLKENFNARVGLIGTIFLQSSFYLANYFKIGYVNPLSFTFFIASLYFAARLTKEGSINSLVALAVLLGLSFYVYIGPLFILFLLPYFFMIQRRVTRSVFIKYIIVFMSIFTYLLLPVFSNRDYLQKAFEQTSIHKQFQDNSQILVNVFNNFFLFFRNNDYLNNHFIAGPYLDIVTGALFLIGILWCIANCKKNKYLLLLSLYITLAITIGLTSPYSYSPATRGIFFIPFGVAFAAVGFDLVFKKLGENKFLYLVFLLIFSINLYKSQIEVFQMTGYTGADLIVKEFQDIKIANNPRKIILVASSPPFDYQDFYVKYQAYGFKNIFELLKPGDIGCKKISHAEVMYFGSDTSSVDALSALRCYPKDFFTKKLDPAFSTF